MKFSILFFILLLACMCPSLAQGSYENCCLKYVAGTKKSTRKRVQQYRIQETDGGCNIRAVIFTLKNKKRFCANPDHQWVKNLITEIDKNKNGKI